MIGKVIFKGIGAYRIVSYIPYEYDTYDTYVIRFRNTSSTLVHLAAHPIVLLACSSLLAKVASPQALQICWCDTLDRTSEMNCSISLPTVSPVVAAW